MNSKTFTAAVAAILGLSITASAVDLLSPGDFIIAIDSDFGAPSSGYPGGENPSLAIDGTSGTKYLNFGGAGSGFIVRPSGSSIVQSFQITTANDASGRNPSKWALWGTNDPIVSLDNSDGSGELWTLIGSGNVALPPTFFTPGPFVSFGNAVPFAAYRMTFPSLSGDALMQIGEVQFYTGSGGTGSPILAPGNPIIAIDTPAPESGYPSNEAPVFALDGSANTKYLNFGRENSGFIVTPTIGLSIVNSFRITTANDEVGRDPSTWAIYGSNSAIGSFDNSTGTDEPWTLIASGAFDGSSMPAGRQVTGTDVMFTNSTAYTSYKMIFPENVGPDGGGVNSMQIADVQFGGVAVPEPSGVALALLGACGLGLRRRRS